MDRNTLLAFFLIALVLILTPKYMEMFSPKKERSFLEKRTENPAQEPTPSPIKEDLGLYNNTNNAIFSNSVQEKIITIENNLYIAKISSRNGGTFTSFSFKNYFDQDSQEVDIINPLEKENLVLQIKNQNGSQVDLTKPWKYNGYFLGGSIKEETILNYSKEIHKGVFITKTISFYPDSYKISCSIDASSVPRETLANEIIFGWVGGLKSTEKNIEDDFAYFQSYVFLGGEQEKLKVKPGKPEVKTYNGSVDWSAIRTKYFTLAILPKNPNLIQRSSLSGIIKKQETYSSLFSFRPEEKTVFDLYLGPLEYSRIKMLGRELDNIMDFGWAFVRPISKGVLYVLTEMHKYIPNYGFILILFSILIKIIVYPLTKKSYQSTAAMQQIQPELTLIREKYKNNAQKLNQAQMQLYKKRGVNPLGGCLPMLIQMPLLFALFIVFRTTIELRAEPFVWWITDLSTPDAVINLPFKIPIYGSHIAILPIFMVISMFIQQKMMSGGAAQQPQQKIMQYFMTAFFFLIFNSFPSGLNLYYTLFNILTIAQQKLIPSTELTKNEQ